MVVGFTDLIAMLACPLLYRWHEMKQTGDRYLGMIYSEKWLHIFNQVWHGYLSRPVQEQN